MSRVGKKPILISEKTKISYENRVLTVQGAKGTLTRPIHPAVELNIENGVLNVVVLEDKRTSRALQGLTRSLVANMVTGVSEGFERTLLINGIGYKAELKGNDIIFNVGFSNPVTFGLPDGISASIERNTTVKLSGIDKGKGIKYAEEYIRRKAGKAGVSAQQ
jgi:large subunit ribosomal protein L6